MSGRILIVDDVATNRIVYRARLVAGLYDPVLAADGQACLQAVLKVPAAERPDLVLLALNLPDMPGAEVVRRLRADPRGRAIPVIALTAAGDVAARLEALQAGADAVITTPVAKRLLLARVRNLLRAQAEGALAAPLAEAGFAEAATGFEMPGTLAIVTVPSGHLPMTLPQVAPLETRLSPASPASGQAPPVPFADLREDLSRYLPDRLVRLSRSHDLAAQRGITAMTDVFIVQSDDAASPGTIRLMSELKSHHATRTAAVCLIDGAGQADAAAMAFDLGADDVVGPEVSLQELALRLGGLMRRKRAADRRRSRVAADLRLAMVDPLTGLFNRRYATPHLADIAAKAAASGTSYAVMLVDIDRFKLVNDRHGHASGDAVLVEVARRLTANLREDDLVARIGGEEFLIALP